MHAEPTVLDGVVEFTPRRFSDGRGWFSETWNSRTFLEAGVDLDWVQDNESFSQDVGTVRGIHFQSEPMAQDKLVRVAQGKILDVAVDLRRSSSAFGQWVAGELSADAGNQLLVPKGYGHAFCTLVPECLVQYKVSNFYSTEHDRAVAWNDPTIGIDWPDVVGQAVVSAKDLAAPLLHDALDLFS